MHIGFLTPEYPHPERPGGGLGNYLRSTGRALGERGHEVTVLTMSSRDAEQADGPVSVHEVRRVTLPGPLGRHRLAPFLSQYLSSRRIAAAFRRIHASKPFDILQASSYRAPAFALRRNGEVPVVCRISSYTPLVRSAHGSRRNLAMYLSDWMEIRQVLDAEAAFSPSELMVEVFRKLEGFTPDVLRTPAATCTGSEDPSLYDDRFRGKRYLLFFGTLSRIKGVDLIGDVIPALARKHPDLYFAFVGRDDGMPGRVSAVDDLRRRSGSYADRIIYHEAVAKALLLPVVRHAAGVLMPSRIDNYPNACLEAQHLGIPVVCTDRSSLDEIVVDGETGFVVRNDDAESLLEGIERLLALSEVERDRMQARIHEAEQRRAKEDRIGLLVEYFESNIAAFRNHR